MSKSNSVEHDSESTNSFLDVITSSIGILIILVMVAGQRSQQAIEQLAREPLDAELKAAANEAAAVEQDIHRIAQQNAIVENELAAGSAQRGQISTLIRVDQQELAERRGALDQNARSCYDWNAIWRSPATSLDAWKRNVAGLGERRRRSRSRSRAIRPRSAKRSTTRSALSIGRRPAGLYFPSMLWSIGAPGRPHQRLCALRGSVQEGQAV